MLARAAKLGIMVGGDAAVFETLCFSSPVIFRASGRTGEVCLQGSKSKSARLELAAGLDDLTMYVSCDEGGFDMAWRTRWNTFGHADACPIEAFRGFRMKQDPT